MTQQRQQAGLEAQPIESSHMHSFAGRSAVRTLRPSGTSIAALTLGLVAVGAGAIGLGAVRVSPAQTTQLLDNLSSLLSFTASRHAPEHAVLSVEPQPETATANGTNVAASAAAAAGSSSALQNAICFGDKLKITFFESVGVSLGDDAARKSGAPAVTTVFPRMDLSGDYTVDGAGTVDIPRLGRLNVASRDVNLLESQLAGTFRRVLGRPVDVHVAILERQPVYVLGGPRGGTTVRHAPGMIVLQALAEAGGAQRNGGDTSRAIETIRETQRLGETQDRLARALVRQAQLVALRDGQSSVTLSPATAAKLAEMLPQDTVEGLLADAATTLNTERQAQIEQLGLAERLIGIAKSEVAAQNLRVTQARALAQNKAARLHDLQGIAAHGSVSQFKVADAAVDVAEGTAKQEDLQVGVAQAESRLAEAEIARVKVVQTYTTQVASNLAATTQEVRDLSRAIVSIRSVIDVLGDGAPSSNGGKAATASLRIVRRGGNGPLVMPATPTTLLMPGDVLQIDPS